MRRVLVVLLWIAINVTMPAYAATQAQAQAQEGFRILAYHDVRDDPAKIIDRYTVSTRTLTQHFEWLRANGYSVISVDDILRARAGVAPLPPKSVLLTFDDGYRSVYTHVFPLLKAFNYPAVIGLVGSWIEATSSTTDPQRPADASHGNFVRWDEVREMAGSGLIEVASHTHDLHRGVPANPQGDSLPAAVSRHYDASSRVYETLAQYELRIRRDLELNSEIIAREVGERPRVIIWPYGRHSPVSAALAHEVGLTVGLTLEPGANQVDTPLVALGRDLMVYDPSVNELAATFTPARAPPMRVMHVDLDYVYDADAAQQRANVGRLLDRVRAMGINTVFLQAFADPDGNGAADALYFPNRHLPVRADLFSHVAWQLHTRANVNVYAWMPVLGYERVQSFAAADPVLAVRTDAAGGIPRVSPFSAATQTLVREVYEDLARHATFQGLLFHDDATLNDFEDASAAALRHYSQEWDLPANIGLIRADEALRADWSRRKSRHLTTFTLGLAEAVRRYQQRLPTARNLYARVILEPPSEEWFAQNFGEFVAAYDYTAIMAMPFMEGEDDALPWLNRLIGAAARQPNGLTRSVFELQSRDWRNNRQVPSQLIADKMRALQQAGALHFGYYPDDFHVNHPALETIKPYFSLETFPYRDPQPR